MPSAVMTDELARLVEEQVRSILDQRRGLPFTMEHQDTLDSLSSQVGSMLQDRSMGRILNGPLWLSGTSVVDGTITAGKLEVTELSAVSASAVSFNVTGNITAAASFPAAAARIVINSSGLYGYQSDGVTTTFKLNVDGSGEIGSGANKASWTSAGVLSIPAATITSLTIANINTGVIGGTYTTSAGTAKISISTSGITATDSGGNTTFSLNATTGAMTATGSFTVQSAGSGTRVVISSSGGIEGYNGTTQTFLLNAATGAGQLGPTSGGNYISWSSTGVTIGGVALSGGKITASHLSVTNLAAISADMGTITAGSISAARITAGTFINGSTGTIAFGAADLSIASTGKLTWEGGASYIDSGGIVLSSAGSFGDSIKWINAGSDIGSIYAASGALWMWASSGKDLILTANGSPSITLSSTGVSVDNGNGQLSVALDTKVRLGDAAGTYVFSVRDSANQVQFSISSNGAFVYPDADATALGAYAGRIPWYVNGNLRYVPYYN